MEQNEKKTCGTCKACHRTDNLKHLSTGAAVWVCLRLASREIEGPYARPLDDCPGHEPREEAAPASLSTPEPAPTEGSGPPVWDLVIEDMRERDRVGRERYGTPLRAHNGRRPLMDAYQEALDLAVYLRQEVAERETHGSPEARIQEVDQPRAALHGERHAREALPEDHGYREMPLPEAARRLSQARAELGARVREKAERVVELARERAKLAVEKENMRTAWELSSKHADALAEQVDRLCKASNSREDVARVEELERERARADQTADRALGTLRAVAGSLGLRWGCIEYAEIERAVKEMVARAETADALLAQANRDRADTDGCLLKARAELPDHESFRAGTLAEGVRRLVKAEAWDTARFKEAHERLGKLERELDEARGELPDLPSYRTCSIAEGIKASRDDLWRSGKANAELLGPKGTLEGDALRALVRAARKGDIAAEAERPSGLLESNLARFARDIPNPWPRCAAMMAVLAAREEGKAEVRVHSRRRVLSAAEQLYYRDTIDGCPDDDVCASADRPVPGGGSRATYVAGDLLLTDDEPERLRRTESDAKLDGSPRCGTCKACHRTDASSGAAIWICLRLFSREIDGPDARPLDDCPGHLPRNDAPRCGTCTHYADDLVHVSTGEIGTGCAALRKLVKGPRALPLEDCPGHLPRS